MAGRARRSSPPVSVLVPTLTTRRFLVRSPMFAASLYRAIIDHHSRGHRSGSCSRSSVREIAMFRKLLTAGVLLSATLPLAAQTGAKNGEWRSYAAEPGSTKYSPLDQINRDNVKDLRIAWRFKTDNLGPRARLQHAVNADRRQRRDVRAGRHPPHSGRARSGERRDAVDVADGRRQARRRRAAAGLGSRARLLDRRQRR